MSLSDDEITKIFETKSPVQALSWSAMIRVGRAIEARVLENLRKQEPEYYGLTGDHTWLSIDKARYDKIKPSHRMACYTEPIPPTPSQQEARSIDEWHEDMGDVLWWKFPIDEPPYVGSPLDTYWPMYHTHWTPIIVPDLPLLARPDEVKP